MAHATLRAMPFEKLQRFPVGKVALPTANAVLKVVWIAALFQHHFIIICFQDSRIAAAEMAGYLTANAANIGKHTHARATAGDGEGVRVAAVVCLTEGHNTQVANCYFLPRFEGNCLMGGHPQAGAAAVCGVRDIHRNHPLLEQARQAAHMIRMLVGDEDCPDAAHVQSGRPHAALRFPAREASVYEDGLRFVANVVAVAVGA